METFAQRYCQLNPNIFSNPGILIYLLLFFFVVFTFLFSSRDLTGFSIELKLLFVVLLLLLRGKSCRVESCVIFWLIHLVTDTCYVLSFAVIILNTSLHNPSVKEKPTLEKFIAMNRGINDGKDLPRDILEVSLHFSSPRYFPTFVVFSLLSFSLVLSLSFSLYFIYLFTSGKK